MIPTCTLSMSDELARRGDAFAAALADDPDTDLGTFLPPRDHPLYLAALAELVRIDLTRHRTRCHRRGLADYTSRFPALLECPTLLEALAREEYIQRRQAGEDVTPSEYRAAFGIDTGARPARAMYPPDGHDPIARTPLPATAVVAPAQPAALSESTTDSLSAWADATQALPELGTEFLGFRLVEELGRGAFGRVYLAHQGTLAGRPVALKIACDIAGESRTLAQLQHTNIVPIYSFHRAGPFQAVCMPYFGRTTLAQVISHLGGRAGLPSSGRELKSTLLRMPSETVASVGSPRYPTPAPAAQRPAPGTDAGGWGHMEGLSYVEAVVWLGAQLADGLAHAHERGILHRDLKPANVLLSDDGRPMLLDFNLAEDTKLRGSAERAAIGGTLPYMAPEQLEAYRDRAGRLDERCDLYALGVILYELLTGRHPFPLQLGNLRLTIPRMLEARRRPLPSVRAANPAVSPATEAIVRKCLAPDPGQRYRRAEQLREDLDRQLNHRPLKYAGNPSNRERARKWVRRHPRLASSGTVATVAAVLLLAIGLGALEARERARDFDAHTRFGEHQTEFRNVQLFLDDRNQSRPRLDEALTRLRGVQSRYGVPEDGADEAWLSGPDVRRLPESDRERLRGDIGETFYHMAQVAHLNAVGGGSQAEREVFLKQAGVWNDAAERYAGARIPRAIRVQRATLADLRGEPHVANGLREQAASIPLGSPRDLFLLGAALTQRGRHRDALPHLRKCTQLDPGNFSAWFVRGTVHLALAQDELAAMCFSSCLALRDDFAPAWLNRGQAFARLRFYEQALDDFDRALALDPNLAAGYIQRAGVRDARGELKTAEADYSRALDTGGAPTRIYFLRADVRDRLEDRPGAKADREKGLSLTPSDELSWIGRAETRLADDPKGALADAEEALRVNPFSVLALQLKAHILAERLNRPEDAEAALNRAVELNPDHVPARAGRGVLLARRGKRDDALRDAKEALRRDTRAPNLYQVACIYALTSGIGPGHAEDRTEAFRLLWSSLKTGFGLDIVETDTDLDHLRNDPEFKRVVTSARAYLAASNR